MRNKKVTVTSSNILFFIFVISFLAFNVILGFADALSGSRIIENNMFSILLMNEYIFILLPVLIFAVIKRLDFKEVFRLRAFGIVPALIIVFASLPAYFAASMLNTTVAYFLQFIGDIPSQTIPVPGNIGELLLGLLVIAFSPALCEEMLNRGIMLKGYENRGSYKAVIITAIFFGIFHFDITNLLGPIFLGILIGYYTIRTNSIFAAMLAHFMNNAIAEILSYIYRNEISSESVVRISPVEMTSSLLYGVVALILLGLLMNLFKRVTDKSAVIKPPISGVKHDIISVVSHWPVIITLVLYGLTIAMYILTIAASKFLI